MDTCTVETGLLRKKPCGHPSVTQCATCERPLCAQHAVAQLSNTGKKSGSFLCQECDAARREHDKSMATVAKSEQQKKMADIARSAMTPPPLPAKKPAAPATGAPAKDPAGTSDAGGIDFTPDKK
jgi:hypothetical protein